MKAFRLRALAAAVLVFTGVALADSVDPAIGVKGGGGGSTQWGDGTGAGSFSIFFDPSTPGVTCAGGICDYTTPGSNPFFITSGSITDFEYSFSQSQNTAFSVAQGSAFNILTVISGVNTANPTAFLSGGAIFPAPILLFATGFAPTTNSIFGDFLLTANGVIQGSTATISSNIPIPAPEPGSLALLLTGLGVLGMRRLRSRRQPAPAL